MWEEDDMTSAEFPNINNNNQEQIRLQREFGLIDPLKRHYYRQDRPAQAQLDLFDYRFETSTDLNHHIVFNDQLIRLDRYERDGKIFRSIVIEDTSHPGSDEDGTMCFSINLIDDGMEAWLEVHHSKEKDGVVIWEPGVGSDEIHLGELVNMDYHRHVALGSPLPQAA